MIIDSELKCIVMAGGKGTRLSAVTNGLIPKDFVYIDAEQTVRGIDYSNTVLNNLGIHDIVYSGNYFLDQYKKEFKGNGYKFHNQIEGDNHGTDLKKIIDAGLSKNNQYLVLPTDMYYVQEDLGEMIEKHQPGRITWGVSHFQYEEMADYQNMILKDDKIVCSTNSPYLPKISAESADPDLFVGGPIMLVDGKLFQRTFDVYVKITS